MTDFTFYNLETAPAESKPLLKSIEEAYGFIPNLFANATTFSTPASNMT